MDRTHKRPLWVWLVVAAAIALACYVEARPGNQFNPWVIVNAIVAALPTAIWAMWQARRDHS